MVDNPISMSLVYKRKISPKISHNRTIVEYSNVMKTINSNTRTAMPLTESYISACNDHNYANENYDKCINILEAVKETDNISQYNKLENIFINNVLPHIEDLSSLKYRVQESGSLDNNIVSIIEEYQIADRILGNYEKINKKSFIDYIFRENKDIMDKCYEVSDIVNNYDMSINNKIAIALETCIYGFYKAGIKYEAGEVLNHITDYFLSINNTLSDLDMSKIQKTIKDTKLVSSLDCKDITFLKEDYNYYESILEEVSKNETNKEVKVLIIELKKLKDKQQARSLINKVCTLIIASYITIETIAFTSVVALINAVLVSAYVVGLSPAILLKKIIDKIDDSVSKFDKEQKARADKVKKAIQKKIDSKKSIKESWIEDMIELDKRIFITESEDFADSEDVKKAIAKYKADQNKDLSKFKKIITHFYAKTPAQVIDETPNILAWIRLAFVFSTAAYNPIITVPIFIVDQFIAMRFKRKEAERMVKIFNKERDKAENKSYTVVNSEKIDKYIKCLDKCIYKLEDYRDNLYSEKELERREELEECTSIIDYQVTLEDITRNIRNIKSDIRKVAHEASGNINIDIADTHLLNFLSEDCNILEYINEDGFLEVTLGTVNDYSFAESYTDRLSSTLKDYIPIIEYTDYGYEIHLLNRNHIILTEFEQYKYENCIPDELRKQFDNVSTICGNVDYLNSLNPMGINKEIRENFDTLMKCPELTCRYVRNSKDIVDIKEFYHLLEMYQSNLSKNEYAKNTEINFAKELLYKEFLGIDPATDILIEAQSIQGLRNIITEGINTANIKTACLNMKKKVVNLSAKEKQLSNTIDAQANVLSRKAKEALVSNRREAIIKGSIIPSFSKLIKSGLVAGATYAVAPTVAVIGVIGALACSKVLTVRERRALLDEIDIELKVVEKQISKAENEDDMKNYRHLLAYQRKLEREKMRIQYKLGPRKQVPSTALAHVDKDD